MRTLVFIALAGPALACTLVEGDRITGADLAREIAVFDKIGAAADFGPAPVAGAQRTMRTAELQGLGGKHGLEVPAAAEACFERATQTLSAASLRDVLAEALGEDGAQIEIVEFTKNPLPLGKIEFLRSGLSSDGLWRGRVAYGDHRSVPVWARVRVTKADGSPVAQWTASKQPLVLRGDTVQVEVRSGAVVLAFDAPAESSGHAGEAVTIRNPANGQRFRATVAARGKVTVQK